MGKANNFAARWYCSLFFYLGFCLLDVSAQQLTITHPMVDGKNTEYATLNVTPIAIDENVNLYVFQNESYVWFAYDYPANSYGTLDLKVKSAALPDTLNLHISAQLGEWFLSDTTQIPRVPTSNKWWNIDGWTGNAIWANGIDPASTSDPRIQYKNAEIREIQLSKARFGKGEWKVQFNINAIQGENGFYTIQFPSNQTYYTLVVE